MKVTRRMRLSLRCRWKLLTGLRLDARHDGMEPQKSIKRQSEEAIRMEREAQRARKASKWQRKQTTGKELDGLLMELGIFFISSLQ
jgi:hypothetical protein